MWPTKQYSNASAWNDTFNMVTTQQLYIKISKASHSLNVKLLYKCCYGVPCEIRKLPL